MVGNRGPRTAVTVQLRVMVYPQGQVEYVAGQVNSARFKYLVGKQAGLVPSLAQKLEGKPIANSALIQAKVGVMTKEEGQRYAAGFVRTLQVICGNQAQVSLIDQVIK